MKVALFVAGPKGANFLRYFNADVPIELVVSYPTKGFRQDSYAEIQNICRAKGYPLCDRSDARPQRYALADIVFLIGWQWLSADADPRFIVFHDSLLPKFRGFNPTVTALILGETELGVTAFSPVHGDVSVADSGPMFGQEKIRIQYPTTIRAVYEELAFAYCRLAERVLYSASLGPLSFSPQDDRNATYSIWRNEDDYRISWAMPAEHINRMVDAVGWPYIGAKTSLQGREIRIDSVQLCPDLVFAQRFPGKIWSLGDGRPEVVCGSGMLRIVAAREQDGSPVKFTSLRVQLM
jgi:methionyl-tRNA formyltransferase